MTLELDDPRADRASHEKYVREKEAMVDRWGGWKHRRWRVEYDADDELALATMARDLDLKPARRGFHNAVAATAAKVSRQRRVWSYGHTHPAVDDLQALHIVDHARMFSVPFSRGAQPGAILLQPYGFGMFGDTMDEEKVGAVLDRHDMGLRVIVHTPYNEGTIGLLLFSASDPLVKLRLQSSPGYVWPETVTVVSP